MQLRPGLAYPRPHCLQAIVRELHPLPLPLEPSLHSAQKPADTSLGVLLLLDLDIAHPHPLVHLLHVSLSPPSLSLCRYLENRSGVPEAAQCRRPYACDAQDKDRLPRCFNSASSLPRLCNSSYALTISTSLSSRNFPRRPSILRFAPSCSRLSCSALRFRSRARSF